MYKSWIFKVLALAKSIPEIAIDVFFIWSLYTVAFFIYLPVEFVEACDYLPSNDIDMVAGFFLSEIIPSISKNLVTTTTLHKLLNAIYIHTHAILRFEFEEKCSTA